MDQCCFGGLRMVLKQFQSDCCWLLFVAAFMVVEGLSKGLSNALWLWSREFYSLMGCLIVYQTIECYVTAYNTNNSL